MDGLRFFSLGVGSRSPVVLLIVHPFLSRRTLLQIGDRKEYEDVVIFRLDILACTYDFTNE